MSPLDSLSSSLSSSGGFGASKDTIYRQSPLDFSGLTTDPPRTSFEPEVNDWVHSEETRKASLEEFWKALQYDSKHFSQKALPSTLHLRHDFEKIGHLLSNAMRQECQLPDSEQLVFCKPLPKGIHGHPRGKSSPPDLVACKVTATVGSELHWAAVSAIVEVESDPPRDGCHAISHTLQLLQARPDMCCGQGFYVGDTGVVLIIANSDYVMLSPALQITRATHVQLLHAFVKRLYEPHTSMVEPTIQRRKGLSTGTWSFDITLPSSNIYSPAIRCSDYKLLSAHRSIGERSHIFCNTENPAFINGVPIPIVKDHYRYADNEFEEAEILRHIHADGPFPGVVEMVYAAESVIGPTGLPVTSGSLTKTRMGFRQVGKTFMNMETPMEALMGIYDLLEITRSLYTARNVLHRDVSDGNVLFTAEPTVYQRSRAATPTNEMCFIRHMLDENVDPLSTVVVLIDFDQAEILDTGQSNRESCHVGTPKYMARSVSGYPYGGHNYMAWIPPPELAPSAQMVYDRLLPNRSAQFTCKSPYHVFEGHHGAVSEFRHRLWHDAESAFWLLISWAVEAQPATGPISYITEEDWYSLSTSDSANRYRCLLSTDAVDPVYEPMLTLLSDLGRACRGDLVWASEAPYNDPEFLHEVMQRNILNFIIANVNEEFMTLSKAASPRGLRPPRKLLWSPKRSGSPQENEIPTKRMKM